VKKTLTRGNGNTINCPFSKKYENHDESRDPHLLKHWNSLKVLDRFLKNDPEHSSRPFKAWSHRPMYLPVERCEPFEQFE
jgi:hypothetical protein